MTIMGNSVINKYNSLVSKEDINEIDLSSVDGRIQLLSIIAKITTTGYIEEIGLVGIGPVEIQKTDYKTAIAAIREIRSEELKRPELEGNGTSGSLSVQVNFIQKGEELKDYSLEAMLNEDEDDE